jgi:hypothetical protein
MMIPQAKEMKPAGCSGCEPMGLSQPARHNPRAEMNMQGLMSLSEVAFRASMSTRFLGKHLSEIPHYRASARGKIWIEWNDFQSWIGSLRVEIKKDDPVVEILRDLAFKRSGAA